MPPDQFFKRGFLAALGQANKFRFFVTLSSTGRECDSRSARCHILWDVCHTVLVTPAEDLDSCPQTILEPSKNPNRIADRQSVTLRTSKYPRIGSCGI